MKVKFIRHEAIAKGIHSFFFEPNHHVHYTAGQYTKLYLPHESADSRGTSRWFTLSSSPTEPEWVITTKIDSKHSSSFKQHLLNLTPNTTLQADEPIGDFVLPQDTSRSLLFVAGGIGVTPYHSMIKWLLDKGINYNIHLLYAATTPQEVAFMPLFKEYGLKLTRIITEPNPDWQEEKGRLDAKRIQQLSPDIRDRLVYLSGPEPMIEQLFDGLTTSPVNLTKTQIVTDYFPNYPSL